MELMKAIRIDNYGSELIAHWDDCDCLEDEAIHGIAEHPVAALRSFIKLTGNTQ